MLTPNDEIWAFDIQCMLPNYWKRSCWLSGVLRNATCWSSSWQVNQFCDSLPAASSELDLEVCMCSVLLVHAIVSYIEMKTGADERQKTSIMDTARSRWAFRNYPYIMSVRISDTPCTNVKFADADCMRRRRLFHS